MIMGHAYWKILVKIWSYFNLDFCSMVIKCMGCGQTDALNPTQLFINFVDLYKVIISFSFSFLICRMENKFI